ncbi:MAG: TatD family hydrolase [Rickettsiales bacterium]|nr:TatD family hydrolase [Rickettsiales bacterium]
MLVDSHCHLNFPELKGDISGAISRAKSAGIGYMQTICTHLAEYEEVYKIAEENQNVFASCGIHPHEADKEQITAEELIKLSNRPKTIGLGECGLDYYYKNSAPENQKKNFLAHIEASRQTGLPVIIHTRDAEEDTYQILKTEMEKGFFPALLHCFTGTADLAKKALDLGLYISISGIVTFKGAKDLQEVVKNVIPLERLLVETDSPFLAPIPHRGKSNEPAFTRNTAEFIANLKNIEFENLANKTTENFFNLFKKAKRI